MSASETQFPWSLGGETASQWSGAVQIARGLAQGAQTPRTPWEPGQRPHAAVDLHSVFSDELPGQDL